ncbi:hypothetical protein AYO47_05065 [Planctomyces sp. SCGC AG-212-M04]|nr:hypothetical protein AYO47_05065 [Planctomyces sp. SCGC AG-212-M04]
MPTPDYNDPDIEDRWCLEQQRKVAAYLEAQKVNHGRIGEWPAWHLPPYLSLWAVESMAMAEWIGWWVICGDVPTDYISAADVEAPQHPRKAIGVFARNWLAAVEAWKEGRELDHWRLAGPHPKEELGPLLEVRAQLLRDFANEDSFWDEA